MNSQPFAPILNEIIINPNSETLQWKDHVMTFIDFYNIHKKEIDKYKSKLMKQRQFEEGKYNVEPNFKSLRLNTEL